MRTILASVLLLIISPVKADFYVCNKSLKPASVAVGVKRDSHWMSKGWYIVRPGECSHILYGPHSNRYIYTYAVRSGGVWGGDDDPNGAPFCVNKEEFEYHDDNCEVNNGYSVKFYRVDLGPNPKQSSRHNLAAEGEEVVAEIAPDDLPNAQQKQQGGKASGGGKGSGAGAGELARAILHRGRDPFTPPQTKVDWENDGFLGTPSPHTHCRYMNSEIAVVVTGPSTEKTKAAAQMCLDRAKNTGVMAGVIALVASIGSGGSVAGPTASAAWAAFTADLTSCFKNEVPDSIKPDVTLKSSSGWDDDWGGC